jgi:hypothetical protein
MRITCDRCGKDRMLSETYTPQRDMLIREIIARMRHDGCGGRAGWVELLTGIGQEVAVLGLPSVVVKVKGRLFNVQRSRGDSVGETTATGVAPHPCTRAVGSGSSRDQGMRHISHHR